MVCYCVQQRIDDEVACTIKSMSESLGSKEVAVGELITKESQNTIRKLRIWGMPAKSMNPAHMECVDLNLYSILAPTFELVMREPRIKVR